MVPNGWKEIKLKDIGLCITGLTYSPKNVVENGLLVFRSSNIQDSKLAFEDNVYVDLEISTKSKTKNGDILLCVRNGSRRLIGKSALITETSEGFAHGAFMGLFRSKDTAEYTYQIFQSSQFFRQVNQNLGATINSINSGNLYHFKFPYPPMIERNKIANILGTWDKAISTTERLIDNSKQQKKSLMQQLLTGRKRLFDDSGKQFNENWETAPLKKCVTFLNGIRKPIKKEDRADIQGKYPYYGATGVIDYVNDYLFDDELILLGEDGENILSRVLPHVFTISGKTWVNNHAHVMKANSDKDTPFLCMYLESLDYRKFNSGSAQPKINKAVCEKIPVRFPALKEQQKITSVLSNAEKEIELLKQQLTNLKQEKKALLQQLLTGKRRVNIGKEAV